MAPRSRPPLMVPSTAHTCFWFCLRGITTTTTTTVCFVQLNREQIILVQAFFECRPHTPGRPHTTQPVHTYLVHHSSTYEYMVKVSTYITAVVRTRYILIVVTHSSLSCPPEYLNFSSPLLSRTLRISSPLSLSYLAL